MHERRLSIGEIAFLLGFSAQRVRARIPALARHARSLAPMQSGLLDCTP
jgi:hypothetical protein